MLRSSLIAAVLLMSVAASAQPAADKPKLMFLGLSPGPRVSAEDASVIGNALQSEVTALDAYSVTGQSEIRTLLGLERQRELLGCADDATREACYAEIGGALNAERAISGDVQRVADVLVLTASLVDLKSAKVLSRETLQGASLQALLDQRELRELAVALVKPDPLRAKTALVDDAAFGGLVIGLRGDADVIGEEGGAVAGVTGEWSGKFLGASITVIPKSNPGLRLEARIYPYRNDLVRPYIGLGATGFISGPGARGAVGIALKLGRFQLFADVAAEKFFAIGDSQTTPFAALIGLGGGYSL